MKDKKCFIVIVFLEQKEKKSVLVCKKNQIKHPLPSEPDALEK